MLPATSFTTLPANAWPHGTIYTAFAPGPSSRPVIGHIHVSLLPLASVVRSCPISNLTSTTSFNPFSLSPAQPNSANSPSLFISATFPASSFSRPSSASRNSITASLLYRVPAASPTTGAASGLRERGQVDQWYSCCSVSCSFAWDVVSAFAASLTSSRRLGMEPPSFPMLRADLENVK